MKTKNKLKIIIENLKSNISSNQFKLILLLLICFNLYGTSYLATNLSYIDGFINIITSGYYVITLFGLILLNTINTFDKFEKSQFFIIRFKDRKMYLKQLLVNVFTSNLVLYILNIIIVLIGLNIFASSNFSISNVLNYSIPNIFYLLFYLLRMFLIFQIINVINVCLLKLINSKVVVFLNMLLCLLIIFNPYEPKKVISSVSNMFWIISEYLRLHYYSGFILEVLCSTIYVSVLFLISYFLFIFTKNRMKRIGD